MGKGGSSQTIGYKYYLGWQQILCHGPIDNISRIKVADKIAWEGEATGGPITISKPKLFGGDKREGGISGTVDIEMGDLSQVPNDYLVARLGSDIPAHRGVVGAVGRQVYMGNNPYLKPWYWRGQRIFVRQEGIEQWYPAKAGIPTVDLLGDTIEGSTIDLRWYQSTKNSGDIDHGRMGISFTDANGADISSVSWAALASPYPWTLRTHSAVAPAGAVGVRLWMNMSKNGTLVNNDNLIDDIEADIDGIPMDIQNPGAEDGTQFGIVAQLSNYNMPNAPGWANTHGYVERYSVGRTGVGCFAGGVSGSVTVKSQVLGLDLPVFDMNPAHMIRECLTDPDWGMGYTDADIDDDSFMAAADTLYAEQMGMSLLWDKQITIEDFIKEIIKHIDAALFVSRTTGKFVLKLIRADYDPDTLLILDESNIIKINNPAKPAFGELVNSVTVNFWNAATGNNDSKTVIDTAMVQMQGAPINTTVQYPGFTNARNGIRAASRDLRTLSSQFLSCVIYADQTARELNIGDVFKLTWGKWQINEKIMRINGLAFGDGRSNQVRITCTEDVFATPENSVIEVDPGSGWVDPITDPEALDNTEALVVEAPYYELVQLQGDTAVNDHLASNPDAGWIMAAAASPDDGSINAQVWVDAGSGYEDRGSLDWCGSCLLAADIGPTDTAVTFTDGSDLDLVAVGEVVQIGNEICRVDAIDIGLGTMTIGRGVHDTVPEAHSEGDRFLFWDTYHGLSTTEYSDGEVLDVKLLPVTGLGELELAEATAISVTMDQRAWRPYPPGNLLIEGESYADGPYEDELSIAWAHRDRTQQTGGTIYDHTFGNIGPEASTVYKVLGYLDGVLVHTEDDIVGTSTTWTPAQTGLVRVEVWSKREGVLSMQGAHHEFFYSANEDFMVTEDGQDIMTTEDDEPMVMES